MAVQDAPGGIGDRFVHVIAVDEYRVEAGDGAVRRGAGPLQKLRQHGEHGGCITAGGRRLADGESDLPLSPDETGDRVHHQQHARALVAEKLRHRCGGESPFEPQHGRLVRGRHDHDGARQALRAQIPLDELTDFTASLADERDDVHVRIRAASDRPEQGAFPHAAARKDPDTLSSAHGQEAVEGAHAQRKRLVDEGTLHRLGRRAVDGILPTGNERSSSIKGRAHRIQHAPQ